jgi:hypothetical protein
MRIHIQGWARPKALREGVEKQKQTATALDSSHHSIVNRDLLTVCPRLAVKRACAGDVLT